MTPAIPRKGLAILALLILDPGLAHSRQRLAEIFWPDLSENGARNNLRQVLMRLQRNLGDKETTRPRLVADRQSLRYEPAPRDWTDVAAFLEPGPDCPPNAGADDCAACLERMTAIVALYRGEFMSGFNLDACPEFETWLDTQRETLHRRALRLLERLADCCERRGDFNRALDFALRFATLDPWNEEGQRRVMRVAALDGQPGVALNHYDALQRSLSDELGVEPEAETRTLAQRIQAGELHALAHQAWTPTARPPVSAKERRQVTVLHCRLTALGLDDPEQALALFREPQARSIDIVESFAGHVVRTNDGGFLAYFGYPRAHERAALLAVRAALAVAKQAFDGIEIRAGIHTGLIVTGADPDLPDTLGWASSLATEALSLAGNGEVVVSEANQRLVAAQIDCAPLDRSVTASGHRMAAFRVVGPRAGPATANALAPLSGREREVRWLADTWQETQNGARQVVLVRGEPGIGKSRLVRHLREGLVEATSTVLEMRCSPELSRSPFHPVTELLAERIGFPGEESPDARFAGLVRYAEQHFPGDVTRAVPLLADLLELPLVPPYKPPTTSLKERRGQTLTLLAEHLSALAAAKPLLLVLEDLHWADPSTLEFLSRLIETQEPASTLILVTARPAFDPPWPEERVPRLSLGPLPDTAMAALVDSLGLALPAETRDAIVRRADGVPLFAEELVKSAAESEGEGLATVPASLRDLLTARLDAMGTAKSIAQLAAAVGPSFSPTLIAALSPLDRQAVLDALHRLEEAGLIAEADGERVHFRHALFRDAAYETQTQADRRATHLRIATVLENEFPEMVRHQPELMARHLQEAAQPQRAIAFWHQAGRQTYLTCAHQEALGHFTAGLSLLPSITDEAEREQLELDLQVGLGLAALATEGHGAQGPPAFARAVELAERVGASAESFQALWGLCISTSSHADLTQSVERARHLLRVAERSGDPVQRQQAHVAIANAQFWRGDFEDSRRHAELARPLYRPEQHDPMIAGYGENAFVSATAFLSWTLALLGHPGQAFEMSREAVAEARRVDHPFTLAYALTFSAGVRGTLGKPEAAQAAAEEVLDIARHNGFPLWEASGLLFRGWTRVQQGVAEGVADVRRSVESVRHVMSGVIIVFLATLADVLHRTERYDEALATIREAQETGARLDDHHADAELLRLKGLCLLARSEKTDAQTCFERALQIARQQRARLPALRAALCLARQNTPGSRDPLTAIVEAFPDDTDTPEMAEAKGLLSAPTAGR